MDWRKLIMEYEAKKDIAIILEVGKRYYCGFSMQGEVKTAWNLAGARSFAPWREEEISRIERRILKLGKTVSRREVTFSQIAKECG